MSKILHTGLLDFFYGFSTHHIFRVPGRQEVCRWGNRWSGRRVLQDGGDAIDSPRDVCVETTSREDLDGQLVVIPS